MIDKTELNDCYDLQGYCVIRNFFNKSEMSSLRKVILKFNGAWKQDN